MLVKLAWGNARRAARDFSVYFLTLVFAVCLLYSFLASSDYLLALSLTDAQRASFAKAGEVLVAFAVLIDVIFCFLLGYANAFLLRRRKREFGLYLLLGLRPRQVAGVLLAECAGADLSGAGNVSKFRCRFQFRQVIGTADTCPRIVFQSCLITERIGKFRSGVGVKHSISSLRGIGIVVGQGGAVDQSEIILTDFVKAETERGVREISCISAIENGICPGEKLSAVQDIIVAGEERGTAVSLIIIHIGHQGDQKLPLIPRTGCFLRSRFRLVQCRKQKTCQNGDDRNRDQQFHQSEPPPMEFCRYAAEKEPDHVGITSFLLN